MLSKLHRLLMPVLFAFILLVNQAHAGGGPENALLIVNAESASSMLLANYYISLREIPERNVIYLSGIPDQELLHMGPFRDLILKPILETAEQRGLAANIDYIIYSSDFPCMINLAAHQKLLFSTKDGNGRALSGGNKKFYHAHASINSVTYFALQALVDDPSYMLLNSNYYYRGRAGSILSKPFVGESQEKYSEALNLARQKDYDGAIAALTELAEDNRSQIAVLYNLARFHSLNGDYDAAAVWLKRAISQGWVYGTYTAKDSAFLTAADNLDFRKVLEEMPNEPFDYAPTLGFRHTTNWGVNGSINGTPENGRRYFLSTILGVTRNFGCTEREALNALRRNAVVDGTHPVGTFYFADTKDVRNRTRKPNYLAAISALKGLGHKTAITNTSIPLKKDRVMGLTNGTPSFNWQTSGSRLMAGSICDNLTSHGGMLNRASQTKCTNFIAAGAAGASGTVIEPFAIQAKFPHPLIHAHYAKGCSLAEAYYQSVHGPFQLLIVGDALCQPFATAPTFESPGLEPRSKVSGTVSTKLDFTDSLVEPGNVELYIDGRLIHRRRVGEEISLNTEKIPDGFHEIRIVTAANNLLQTRGRKIYPLFVNNYGHRVTLQLDKKEYADKENIRVQVESNYGNRIVLKQHYRTLGESDGKEAVFNIPASKVGRGPVKLMAIAYDENDVPVMSVPFGFDVSGPIRDTKGTTGAKPKK